MSDRYIPPFHVTAEMVALVSEISEMVGSITAWDHLSANPRLRRDNRIRTIQATLAIENNTLSLDQVTAIINGKRILGLPGEIREVKNAYEAYEKLLDFDPWSIKDLLSAHGMLMHDLVEACGRFRSGPVGVFDGERLIHTAPPAEFVPGQVAELLNWVRDEPTHVLIKSCVFHYEFEFIHPFADGNGRMGRMWQTLILSRWRALFAWLPVETLIREHQQAYYAVLREADSLGYADPVILFLLTAIREALAEIRNSTPAIPPEVSPQVRKLMAALGSDTLSSLEIMARLGLKSRVSFRQNYLKPALEACLIEMTLPDKPNSRNQKYKVSK